MRLIVWCMVVCVAQAQRSNRLDGKVRFPDETDNSQQRSLRWGAEWFRPAEHTGGFYNRPTGEARYPVHVHGMPTREPLVESRCRCEGSPRCALAASSSACEQNQYLCCYQHEPAPSEYFNEVQDDRLPRYPGRAPPAGPFPAPDTLVGPLGTVPTTDDSRESETAQRGVLIGPGGPTGILGPAYNRPILVGPGGPTGIIGPRRQGSRRPGVLVGPGGPTGIIGPAGNRYSGSNVLVGPGGPTGIIGPGNQGYRGSSGVLVGPGGPTGSIGPGRGLLVGPGGPTGQIGPRGYGNNDLSF